MTKNDLKNIILQRTYGISQKVFIKNFYNFYLDISKWNFPETFSFSQKLYHYLNDDKDLLFGICPECGNRCSYINFKKGYHKYCSSKCSTKSNAVQLKMKQTNIGKYGVDNVAKSDIIKTKIINTNIKKYGCKNAAQSDIVKEKIVNTNIKKYGTHYGFQNNKIKEKIKQTNIERYGAENVFASEYGKNKLKETNIKKYKVEYIGSSKEIQEKIKQTNIKKYGVASTFSDILTQEKIKQTNIKKYDAEYPLQSTYIRDKIKQTNIKKYNTNFVLSNKQIRKKIKQTNLEKYGVEWYCMIASKKSGRGSNSKPNLDFAAKLDSLDIPYEREFSLSRYVYDFKINDILVEINPSITHNCSVNIFGGEPKPADYHLEKSRIAWNAGYRCVHVWDWDDTDRIVCYLLNAVKEKLVISIGACEIKEVSEPDARIFIYENSLFPVTDGQKYSGLFYDDNLIQVVSYRIGDNIGITSLCSNCNVTGGYSGIIRYILDIYAGKRVGATVDLSKYPAGLYKDIFAESSCSDPALHGYRPYDGTHIFDISDIPGISDGFLPIRDCGYEMYVL